MRSFFLPFLRCSSALAIATSCLTAAKAQPAPSKSHVLLISVDGMHALDLANYVATHPTSAFAELSRHGSTYTNARVPFADGAPGELALVTGGTPNSTGVLYSDAWDRDLSPPKSGCKTKGVALYLDEKANFNPDTEDAGGGIDPAKLPLDPAAGCKPVFPHSLSHVNTVFELVHAAGAHTAWIDQHPAYADLLNGPSGTGVDEIYAPEGHVPGLKQNLDRSIGHDELKMKALLAEISGHDHTGMLSAPVPTLFGITLISVSVAQKLKGAGYVDGQGTPTPPLAKALDYTDGALAKMIAALKQNGLFDSTTIIVTSKHGQSPIEVKLRRIVDGDAVEAVVNQVQPELAAHITTDTVGLIWLKDRAKIPAVVAAYRARMAELGIKEIYSGESLKLRFNDPALDGRVPDIILQAQLGVIWADKGTGILAEHGGFEDDDLNVLLLVANPAMSPRIDKTPVGTTQVAPTILSILGMDPNALAAVRSEHTQVLPGIDSKATPVP